MKTFVRGMCFVFRSGRSRLLWYAVVLVLGGFLRARTNVFPTDCVVLVHNDACEGSSDQRRNVSRSAHEVVGKIEWPLLEQRRLATNPILYLGRTERGVVCD